MLPSTAYAVTQNSAKKALSFSYKKTENFLRKGLTSSPWGGNTPSHAHP